MNIIKTEQFIHVTPEEGKVLTDGDITTTSIYLPTTSDISKWTEINESVKVIKLSRDKVVEWCKNEGIFEQVITTLSTDPIASTWFYGKCDYLSGSDTAIYIQQKLQITNEQLRYLVTYSAITNV